jgi:hypothetical protein
MEKVNNWAYIEPIDLNILASDIEVPESPTYKFIHIDPKNLVVDSTYQRSLSRKSKNLIKEIVLHWSWLKFKPPIVTKVTYGDQEYYHVLDGQHTAIGAATNPYVETIPVFLISDSISIQTRADSFVGHNTARTAVSPIQIFKARAESGDDTAIGIITLLNYLKISLNTVVTNTKDCNISCIKTLETQYKEFGREKLKRTLTVLKEAIGNGTIHEWQLIAVSTMLHAKRFTNKFNDEKLSLTIKDFPYSEFAAEIEKEFHVQKIPRRSLAISVLSKAYLQRFP